MDASDFAAGASDFVADVKDFVADASENVALTFDFADASAIVDG